MMEKFTTLQARAVPLPHANVDTDQIIPARYLKATDKAGMGDRLFADWRYNADGSPKEGFVLNEARYQGAQILIVDENFGCGSSREHAAWALMSWGFRAVVSPSFADIFRNNAITNGILPVELAPSQVEQLMALVTELPETQVEIDLPAQTISLPDGTSYPFALDGFSKRCLLEGLDKLGYLKSVEGTILAYENAAGKV